MNCWELVNQILIKSNQKICIIKPMVKRVKKTQIWVEVLPVEVLFVRVHDRKKGGGIETYSHWVLWHKHPKSVAIPLAVQYFKEAIGNTQMPHASVKVWLSAH